MVFELYTNTEYLTLPLPSPSLSSLEFSPFETHWLNSVLFWFVNYLAPAHLSYISYVNVWCS